ncbi:MAG: hypothetical protein JST54_06800 [Deltaproteobacteria bacterium]|nr:hypothetical protein [Deltaproteobacteria bacterium]
MKSKSLIRRVLFTLVGGALLFVGLFLLALPGPGLLVIALGLMVLSWEYPTLRRHADRMRLRAVGSARELGHHPIRFALGVAVSVAMVGAGVVVGLMEPRSGSKLWTGASLVLSGVILLVTLVLAQRVPPPDA